MMTERVETTAPTPTNLLDRMWHSTLRLFAPHPTTLLSPAADVLMAGGASIMLFFLLTATIPAKADVALWGFALYYASFLVNYPHFAASYQLLYHDAGRDFFRLKAHPFFTVKLWWAGCVVPLLMVGYFTLALHLGNMAMMSFSVHAMYFLVGWHYVKQIFGCVIVLSAPKKVFFNRAERWIMLSALYSIWLLSFVASNLGNTLTTFLRIPYSKLHFPAELLVPLVYCFVISAIAMIMMFAWRHRNGKPLPPLSAFCAIISIYVWLTPITRHPYFVMIVPFFHSLQYMLFVVAYKRNQTVMQEHTTETSDNSSSAASLRILTIVGTVLFLVIPTVLILASIAYGGQEYLETIMRAAFGMLMTVSSSVWLRTACIVGALAVVLIIMRFIAKKNAVWHFMQFIVHMLILGGLILSVVPTLFDILSRNNLLPHTFVYNAQQFGPALYLFIFSVFINIHHYFIDNVLWRRDNPNIRAFLFASHH